jgi:hypothetical protein
MQIVFAFFDAEDAAERARGKTAAGKRRLFRTFFAPRFEIRFPA